MLRVCTLFLLLPLMFSQPAYADDALATMAGIVLSIQHFPTAEDKAALGAIGESEASDAVKAIAGAIANINHMPSDADKAALQAIAADDGQPAGVRDLAGIVAGFAHFAGADASDTLKALAGP